MSSSVSSTVTPESESESESSERSKAILLAERSLYRLASSSFMIEERQYYKYQSSTDATTRSDTGLERKEEHNNVENGHAPEQSLSRPLVEPIGDKYLIFRKIINGGDTNAPCTASDDTSFDNTIVIGPAMYTLQGLREREDPEERGRGRVQSESRFRPGSGRVWDSPYAMALYCMDHPTIIRGKGLEVGR